MEQRHQRPLTGRVLVDRMASAEARDLDSASRDVLIILFGCPMVPAVAPRDSKLAPYLDDAGRLNAWGKDVAARVVLQDPQCLPAIKDKAQRHIEAGADR